MAVYRKVVAVVVAAGFGSRMSANRDRPKQYCLIGGKSMLRYSLDTFCCHPDIDHVVVVVRPEDIGFYREAVVGLDLLPPVVGGETRQESVYNGLEAICSLSPDLVLIHDSARPFVSRKIITSVIKQLDVSIAVVPAIPIADSVKKCNSGKILWSLDRTDLWRVQTPHGFRFEKILDLHREYKNKFFTEDSSMCEYGGIQVAVIPGAESNFKISFDDDFARAKMLASSNFTFDINRVSEEFFTGFGSDVHAFDTSDTSGKLILGGIVIEKHAPLKGHSDADVVLHALTNAILGATAGGDIGQHFPSSDKQFSNVSSEVFVKFAVKRMYDNGFRLVNVDVNIICETPNISRYRDDIKKSVADIVCLNLSRVNIKATTTDGLGFLGNREGIEAQVVVTVAKDMHYI